MKVTTVRVRPARRDVCADRKVNKHPNMVEVDLWGECAALVLLKEDGEPAIHWADMRLSKNDRAAVLAMAKASQNLMPVALAKFAGNGVAA